MSGKSGKKKRLGRGLDALIPAEKLESDEVASEKVVSDKRQQISDEVTSDKVISDKSLTESLITEEVVTEELTSESVTSGEVITDAVGSDKFEVDAAVLARAIEEGKKNPRVVVWSPKTSVVLRILKKTIPEFSISKEASKLLEEAVKRKYPEIWRAVEEALRKG